ncbi:hypothetical protein PYW08_003488 [Mythimna loreyi]|uniref:Uncharacterized protein n=1 Tax=Mythimna loreyi TaxID=667449 RepID=A0ACC2QRN1_9NEOP|nr:hypothetical protein PYW08_003488 [Mythimna loreyi]
MFWSGNYIVVRELNFLLKEENVTLSQVLEADDILQECKADNKALIQFLTKPEVLAELITLITEEPPKNLELASQYRHANIACEVLTSHLSMLSDRLSLDATQMNRLCDFINKDPPLNPLLASYFSKTVEMLLERSPKQDCYLYHIVCLRVLDFFKSRRDFLPNLLRHMSTSAIADTFKYFIRLDDLFKKTVMEWLEEHQFLECLIQIVCGTYVPEELAGAAPEPAEKAERELSEKSDVNHKDDAAATEADAEKDSSKPESSTESSPAGADSATAPEGGGAARREQARARIAAVASANAAALLCDLIVNGCAGEGCSTRPRTSWALVARLAGEAGVRALLAAMFTSPARARTTALVNGCQVLRALLMHEPILMKKASSDEESGRGGYASSGECEERSSVELAVAPHLPLLHHALLHDPASEPPHPHQRGAGRGAAPAAAAPRAAARPRLRAATPARESHYCRSDSRVKTSSAECEERSSVELAVAPHLPLLHHALLHDPASEPPHPHSEDVVGRVRGAQQRGAGRGAAPAAAAPRAAARPRLRAATPARESHYCRSDSRVKTSSAECEERSSVELAVAPHLPLLHHALLHDPASEPPHPHTGRGEEARPGSVGLARVQVAALLAHLALSEVEEVPTTMLTLGTPGVLVDMFFRYPNNNFLHAQVYTLVKHALTNRVYRTQYARHLFVECDLLTRLMDVFEENKNNKNGPRAAYMGHVVLMLARAARALSPAELLAHALALPAPLAERWQTFLDDTLRPLLQQHDTPLGGYYPSENIYEVEIMADTLAANYDYNDMAATATMDEQADDVNADDANEMCGAMGSTGESADFIADGLGIEDEDKMRAAERSFLERASQRFDDDMWEESGDAELCGDADDAAPAAAVRDVLEQHSPWENLGGSGGAEAVEGWAQFSADSLLSAHDPFAPRAAAPPADGDEFSPFWSYSDTQHAHDPELEASMRTLRLEGELSDRRMDEASSVELANNLLTAMSAMSADAIANIVNANLAAGADVSGVRDVRDVSDVRDVPDAGVGDAGDAPGPR